MELDLDTLIFYVGELHIKNRQLQDKNRDLLKEKKIREQKIEELSEALQKNNPEEETHDLP